MLRSQVNVAFLLLLVVTKPMAFFPSSFFEGWGLIRTGEIFMAAMAIAGNLVAVWGAAKGDESLVKSLGYAFAIFNFAVVR